MLHNTIKDFSQFCAGFMILMIEGFLLSFKVFFVTFHVLGFDFIGFKHLFAFDFEGQQVVFPAFVVFVFILDFGEL